jgi:hypothetical protein
LFTSIDNKGGIDPKNDIVLSISVALMITTFLVGVFLWLHDRCCSKSLGSQARTLSLQHNPTSVSMNMYHDNIDNQAHDNNNHIDNDDRPNMISVDDHDDIGALDLDHN